MIEKVINIAQNEVGYLEKKSNSQLDDKTANAGSNNYTKYARDLDNITGFYNGRKNGFSWCDIFVDWCFVKAFGTDKAKELLCQTNQTLGAGCTYSARYYKNNNQFHNTPKKGDQIFFYNKSGSICHTGIVIDVDSENVHTIEGNTSSSAGVIANGGCVRQKKYSRNYSLIAGYGRPKYDEIPIETPVEEKKPIETKNLMDDIQNELNKRYDSKLVVDGIFGPLTKKAMVKGLQKEIGAKIDGIFGPKTKKLCPNIEKGAKGNIVYLIQARLYSLGYDTNGVEGDFGNGTDAAIKKYQSNKKLDVDGICGKNTFESLFK